MWDFSHYLILRFFFFFNYWPDIFRLKQLSLYVQQEGEGFIWEDKCSVKRVAGILKCILAFQQWMINFTIHSTNTCSLS